MTTLVSDMELNTIATLHATAREKYVKVQNLLDHNKDHDPAGEPYKAQYAAIQLLLELEKDLAKLLILEDTENKVGFMLAVVYLRLGILHTGLKDSKAGMDQFTKCIDLLKGKERTPDGILIASSTLNKMGITWSEQNEISEAKACFEEAEAICKDFYDINGPCVDPITLAGHFGAEEANTDSSPKEMLERIHTLSTYYIAQIYSTLKEDGKSILYCHLTLCRVLRSEGHVQNFDCIEWALNCATLSQYFIEHDSFSNARYHLAAATYVLQKAKEEIKKKDMAEGESEALAAEWETFNHRNADICRCWSKYGIQLLSSSAARLLGELEDKAELTATEGENEAFVTNFSKFETIEEQIKPYVNQITDEYLLVFSDARPVFISALKWLADAQMYYTLENHASDYASITLDISKLYKCLAFFEEDESRQAKMHKRRTDILEHVINELNPQYYLAVCRELWVEVGETYTAILDIKFQRMLDDNKKASPQVIAKINHLAKSAMKYYQFFVDSVGLSEENMPELADDLMKSTLNAYFQLGRLHNKLIMTDPKEQLIKSQRSLATFELIFAYCQKHPKAAEAMPIQLSLCKELVDLLPVKIEILKREVGAIET